MQRLMGGGVEDLFFLEWIIYFLDQMVHYFDQCQKMGRQSEQIIFPSRPFRQIP